MIYYVAGMPYSAELRHYGIKGMKWGVRRFENPDGTLTSAGKERYYRHKTKNGMSDETKDKLKKAAKVAAITAGTALAAYGTYRLAKSGAFDRMASKTGDIVGASIAKAAQRSNDKAARRREISKRLRDSAFSFKMSDKQLLERIGRLENEAKLRNLTYESIMSPANPESRILRNAGRKIAETAIAGAGLYGIKSLLTNKIDPKDAANYITPKPKTK